jgi:hypothetical protein
MTDRTNAIIDISQRFADLQKRLAEVEAERLALKQEIQTVQERLAAVVPPAFGSSNRTQVLWVLRRDDEHAYSPLDICRQLGRVRDSDVNAVRLVLGRLTREGKVTRISHGRYRINQAV